MHTQQVFPKSPKKGIMMSCKLNPQQSNSQSDENQIYLNTILPTLSLTTAQKIKSFNRKLKISLKDREADKAQSLKQNINNGSIKCSVHQKAIKHDFPLITPRTKGRINNSLQIIKKKKNIQDLSLSKKKSCPDNNQSVYHIPILNEQDENSHDSSSYIERLLTSQSLKILMERIVKRKKLEKSIHEEYSKNILKCPLNKRIFNKICKETSTQKLQIQAVTSQKKQKQSQIAKFFKQRNVFGPNKYILSPIKQQQRQIKVAFKVNSDSKPIIKFSSQQFGPWKHDNLHMNVDL